MRPSLAVVGVIALTGCGYHLSVHAGPRIDAAGRVAVEFGMSLGAAVIHDRTGPRARAVTASIDGGGYGMPGPDPCRGNPPGCAPARASMPTPASTAWWGRGSIRGVVEWHERPRTPEAARGVIVRPKWYARAPGLAWSAGAYGGIDADEGGTLGMFGATASIAPWTWEYYGDHTDQWLGLGLRVGVEMIPEEEPGRRVAARVLLMTDVLHSERRR